MTSRLDARVSVIVRWLREGLQSDALHRLLVDESVIATDGVDGDTVDALLELRWARRDGAQLVPLVGVDTWQGLVVAHDLDRPDRIEQETVLGVNNTTRSLAALTPRRRVRRALDLATGPGALALRLARHADEVIATDLSERACRYATLNGELNDVSLDVREGDLYEPVADEAPFDLITANLPFVVGPDTAYTFRDGGRDRDSMSRDAVAGAVEHLAPGGVAVLMCNWLVPSAGKSEEIPFGWTSAPGVSIVVLHHSVATPADYAARWNKFLLAQDAARYAATIDRWNATFEEWRIDGIASGAVIVHRAGEGASFRRTFTMSTPPAGEGGAQVDRIIANNTLLDRYRDEDVLAACPALVAPHRLDQVMRFDGSWSAGMATLALDDTAGVTGTVEPLAIHSLLRVDGETTVAHVVDEAAEATGIDRDALVEATVRSFRQLASTGCLTLVGKAAASAAGDPHSSYHRCE